MDFYQIKEREGGTQRRPTLEVYPDFKVVRSKDLMVRGRSFYAIWDEMKGLWSTDEYDVQRLVDATIRDHKVATEGHFEIVRKYLGNFTSNSWMQFRNYIGHVSDNWHPLDSKLTFKNTEVTKEDYVSKRLPYDLAPGDTSAWDEMMSVLYEPAERAKIEWALGCIIAGDSKSIQKFLVLYGSGGTGKSTVLNIIQKMFDGYYAIFEAKALTSENNQFSTEAFKSNPLVAIQHDGDLSKIADNSKLNSIVAHEKILINEKHKPSYEAVINAFLFMGTNKPVKITDAQSGIIRRLIDVRPTGNRLSPKKYQALNSQIDFEIGAIAAKALETYREMGKDYYENYQPIEMMLQTDVYFNFVEDCYNIFKKQDGVSLKQAYSLWKKYREDSGIDFTIPQYKFRDELKNYFHHFEPRAVVNGVRVASWFSGFKAEKFKLQEPIVEEHALPLVLDETESLFDKLAAGWPAQYANAHGTPIKYWRVKTVVKVVNGERQEVELSPDDVVTTVLSDLDTHELHYVKVEDERHIVIDFDLADEEGNKSLERNLEEASKWPPTYAEYSQGGAGIHLHYIYEGDPEELRSIFKPGVEVKVFRGDTSLRRRLTRCNSTPVANLAAGSLPIKEIKVMDKKKIEDEKHLRALIKKALRKEVHPNTKSNIDYIAHVLEEAYMGGVQYDVTDMRNSIIAFANRSSNNSIACLNLVTKMRFHSEPVEEEMVGGADEGSLAFFDIEVFPNLIVISWKFEDKFDSFGQRIKQNVVRMINPSPQAVEELMRLKLVGYNCRRYDNHILYAIYMGASIAEVYRLSQKIVANEVGAGFREAYNISYVDVYDYMSEKMSLKEAQIKYGLKHKELGLPWDQPVPEELWDEVGKYCDNDVITLEQVHEKRRGDYMARLILADISGLRVNASTASHAAKIIFNGDKNAKDQFKYTDLSQEFPGYEFKYNPETKKTESTYKGFVTGEGGLVDAEPGFYRDVALLDVESMHPTSINMLDAFGDYTKNFVELLGARTAIKRKDFDTARKMFGGKLAKYLENEDDAKDLSYALKIAVNIVYGLTSASFDNAFRDPRNIDNIVAKRGALFMIELKLYLASQGIHVIHIKTDSVKIPNATPDIIRMVMEFGDRYGYRFDHEKTFEKFVLVNKAVYVGKTYDGREPAHWEAVGKQFQEPYVFKTLFSREPIEFEDLCETRSVRTAMYLDFQTDKPMVLAKDQMRFVGKTGQFTPIKPGKGGGTLMRQQDDKFHAVTGTTGYFWMESENVRELGLEKEIDRRYFDAKVDEAKAAIAQFTDVEEFRE